MKPQDHFPIGDELIYYALKRLSLSSCRQDLLKLDETILIDLCRRLADRSVRRHQALIWLRAQGVTFSASSFYRFADALQHACLASWHELTDPGLLTDPPVLTVREVARRLRVKPETARRLVSDGELPGVRIGKTIRIPSREFRAFLAGRSLVDPSDLNPVQSPSKRRTNPIFGQN